MKRLAPQLLALALLIPVVAQAHDTWIVPSATVLSGGSTWITADAAVGNDKFYFDHRPLPLTSLIITAPGNKAIDAENKFTGHLRSSFDVHLTDDGTYRLALVNHGLAAHWKKNGETKRWFGRIADFATKVPVGADGLDVQERVSRVETFATKGKPSAIAKVDKGMALVPVTHPNDLFSGEKAKFIITVDGAPAARTPVEIIPADIRYRDSLETIKLTTGDNGEFEVTWPRPGRYWLHTEREDEKVSVPAAKKRILSYSATLEVLPQ